MIHLRRAAGFGSILRETKGLTLFELLIVIVMIGILSAMAASRLDWNRYRADSVSRGAMAQLAIAQREAISKQANVRVTVQTTRLLMHFDDNDDGVINNGERVLSVQLDFGFQFGKGSAPDLPSPADPGAITSLIFRRDGTASQNGTFYIRWPGYDPACRKCRAIAVAKATGRVVWYTYSTGTWIRGN